MAEFFNKWKAALKYPNNIVTEKKQYDKTTLPPKIPDIDAIRTEVATILESLNLPERVKQLEDWKRLFADPKIKDNILNLEQRYKDVVDIYNRLIATSKELLYETEQMASPINKMVQNIGYLETDLNEIKEALRIGWLKFPDPISAAKHIAEAVYHLIVINKYLKEVLLGLKNRLFASMNQSLSPGKKEIIKKTDTGQINIKNLR